MARRSKKADPKLILRWVLALGAVLAIMATLAVVLKNQPAPSEPQETTTLTLAPNPYGVEDFGYDEKGYLTCLAGESIPGIDVSSHQGTIDWPKVKAAGMEFAFIRLGYRGYDSGTLHADSLALTNLREAKAAGLKIGAYFFSQALTMDEAVEEAQFALAMLEGVELDLPLVYDWEYVSENARTGQMEPDTLMTCVNAFCGAVDQGGYEPMVYFNRELSKTLLDLTELSDYPFWLAMYTDQMNFPYKVDFWQYSDEGQVPGIEGNVDLNLYFPS
jgi:GH25 family lysozyme M1 (1,4-beta-N-acetylmuramidase)